MIPIEIVFRLGSPLNTEQGKELSPTIAKPTSAFLSAGPSLVPSPVTATT